MARAKQQFVTDLGDRHSDIVPVGRCTAGPVMELRRFGQPVTRFVASRAQMLKIRAKSGKLSVTDQAIAKANICGFGRR